MIATRKTILVVEDDPDLRTVLGDIFVDHGLEVVGLRDGAEAVRWLAENGRPDAMVLDLMMPVMSGRQVLDWIDRQQELKDVPVIILSAVERSEGEALAAAHEGTRFLAKPVDVDVLLGALEPS